jgi:hypothetical protein
MNTARLRRYFRHGMFPQLVAFEACIRHGSVTRAAEELSLAQPTVSCLVKKLSDTLGGPLTMSRDRRIEPTPLGLELLSLCHEVFGAFESFDARRSRGEGGPPDSGFGDEPEEAEAVEASAGNPRSVANLLYAGPAALESVSSYDRRAALFEAPSWQSPYPQRKLSRSKPRASHCPLVKPKPSETTGES